MGKPSLAQVSYQNDKLCMTEGGQVVDSQIARQRGSICEGQQFLYIFKLFYLFSYGFRWLLRV